MTKSKRLKAVLTACLLIVGMGASLPATMEAEPLSLIASAGDEEYTEGTYGDLTYRNYGTYIEIVRCNENVEIIDIPEKIDELPVTNIGGYAFQYCDKLSSIFIPDGVKIIGMAAFMSCTNLTSISIPNNVVNIGWGAFSACTSLKSIIIPNGITTICGETFQGCTKLDTITIPNTVTSIEKDAFKGTEWLKNERIKNPLVVVNNILIDGTNCKGDIVIPDNVVSIGERAFSLNKSLDSVTIPNSIKNIRDFAFAYTNLADIFIPDSVENIGWGAFDHCTNLTSITISDGITKIDTFAFYGCKELTNIYYTGVEEQWNAIEISEDVGEEFLTATIHYNSTTPQEEQPEVTVSSLIELNKLLHSKQGAPLKYDLNGDNIINVIDLALLKRQLLGNQ